MQNNENWAKKFQDISVENSPHLNKKESLDKEKNEAIVAINYIFDTFAQRNASLDDIKSFNKLLGQITNFISYGNAETPLASRASDGLKILSSSAEAISNQENKLTPENQEIFDLLKSVKAKIKM